MDACPVAQAETGRSRSGVGALHLGRRPNGVHPQGTRSGQRRMERQGASSLSCSICANQWLPRPSPCRSPRSGDTFPIPGRRNRNMSPSAVLRVLCVLCGENSRRLCRPPRSGDTLPIPKRRNRNTRKAGPGTLVPDVGRTLRVRRCAVSPPLRCAVLRVLRGSVVKTVSRISRWLRSLTCFRP